MFQPGPQHAHTPRRVLSSHILISVLHVNGRLAQRVERQFLGPGSTNPEEAVPQPLTSSEPGHDNREPGYCLSATGTISSAHKRQKRQSKNNGHSFRASYSSLTPRIHYIPILQDKLERTRGASRDSPASPAKTESSFPLQAVTRTLSAPTEVMPSP